MNTLATANCRLFREFKTKMASAANVFCRFHPDAQLIEDFRSGDQICRECGLIVTDRAIDLGSEWRTFGSERCGGDASRVGAPENPLLCGSDLGTTILGGDNDAFDELGRKKYQSNQRSENSDRVLLNAFKEMSSMAEQLGLSKSIAERANNTFKAVVDKNIFKLRSKNAIASACLYTACRQENIPRTFREICAVSRISKKEIGRCFKLILRSLGIELRTITAEDFMKRFCTNLKLSSRVQEAASKIAERAVYMDLVAGRSPMTVTAAAIYMASQASDEKRTHTEISKAADVAGVTVRQTYKLMYPHAEDLFPTGFQFFTCIEELPLH